MRFLNRARHLIKRDRVVDKLEAWKKAAESLDAVQQQGTCDVEALAEKQRLNSRAAIEFSEAYESYKALPVPQDLQNNPEFEDNEALIKAGADRLNLEGLLEGDAPDFVDLLDGPSLYSVADKSIDKISARDQDGAPLRFTDGAGGQGGSLVFTDKNGRLRKPTPEEFTRDETRKAFDGVFNPFMNQAIESGSPVDAKTTESFHRNIENVMGRRKDRFVGEHRRGVMMDSSRSFKAKKIEETVRLKDLAKEKLTALIDARYGLTIQTQQRRWGRSRI